MLVGLEGVAGCSGGTADAGAEAAVAGQTVGAQLFAAHCAPCHGQDGHGIPGVYPSLAGSPVVLGDPRALARWVIRGDRPATMPTGRYTTAMIRAGWLSREQAAALFTYLRTSFGNSAPAIDAATIDTALGPS